MRSDDLSSCGLLPLLDCDDRLRRVLNKCCERWIIIDSRGALEFPDTALAYVVEFVFSACLLGMPRTGFGTFE